MKLIGIGSRTNHGDAPYLLILRGDVIIEDGGQVKTVSVVHSVYELCCAILAHRGVVELKSIKFDEILLA